MPSQLTSQRISLPSPLHERVQQAMAEWESDSRIRKVWDRDESVWTSSGESNWLGWLDAADSQLAGVAELERLADDVRDRYEFAVLLGMGGSSLCPEVLRLCFGKRDGFPDFSVLDSTDPGQVRACEESIDLGSTLFLSASKSGSTLETALLTDYFLGRLSDSLGPDGAGSRFVAITDPGSALEAKARDAAFWKVFHGVPSIGGRYSALSHFGMVPAAVMGLDVRRLLEGAVAMQRACSPDTSLPNNPGLELGLAIGAAAAEGRDKLTLIAGEGVAPLGAWIEQLIAESTGKFGRGIVPIDREPIVDASTYGQDRFLVFLEQGSDRSDAQSSAVQALSELGHPVVQILYSGPEDLGQEFFRWEMATAVAGAVLGINPFDQPDVEASKIAARKVTAAYEETGALPAADAFFEESGIGLFAAPERARALMESTPNPDLASLLRSHIAAAGAGDYFGLLAYIPRDAETEAALSGIRDAVRGISSVATCVGFGPRFLHSTGQLHKGGPNTGVFLQIGCDDPADIAVPGRRLSFGVVKAAQALGDFEVLTQEGRRAMRVHIKGDLREGLARIEAAIRQPA